MLLHVVAAGHVNFAADYRLYFRELLCRVQELINAVHVAVVGDGKCLLTVLLSFPEQFRNG